MSKSKLGGLILILIIVGFGIWFSSQRKVSLEIDWDDPKQVFAIDVPEDFDEGKLERVNIKTTEAKKLYQEKPEDNWTWDTIGDLYDFVGDYERAIGAYERALAFQPADITATLNIAKIYEKNIGDYTKAEDYYAKAISIFPDNPDLYDRLAKLYWRKLESVENAEATYLEALDKTSYHPDALLDIINFYEQTDKIEEQIKYAGELLDRYPDNDLYQSEYSDLIK